MTAIPHRPGGVRQVVARLAGVARGSLLPKILTALLIAVALGTLATLALETRMTRRALGDQAREVLRNQLEVLQAAIIDRQSVVAAGLRTGAGTIALLDITDPPRPAALAVELDRLRRSLGLDVVAAVASDGEYVETVGAHLELPPAGALTGLTASGGQLLRAGDGRYVQTVAVTIGAARPEMLLLGGWLFDDGAAFRLRALTGHGVILVADGEVVGTTLAEPLTVPPAFPGSAVAAHYPAVVELHGADALVDYLPVSAAVEPWQATGTVGLVVADPVAALDRSLARARLVSAVALITLAVIVGWALFRHLTGPLRHLAATARRIAAGDLNADFAIRTEDEVGQLADALEQMRHSIRSQMRVIHETSEELRDSTQRIMRAQDEARRRLAADLHDGIQRELVMLRVRLSMIRQKLREHPHRLEELWPDLVTDVDRVVEAVRETSHRIFPSILQDSGLATALHSLAGRLPVNVRITLDPEPLPRLPLPTEADAYFFVSEAITNAVKHGAATIIHTTATLVGETLRIAVTDNGCGFATDGNPVGLLHLRDRVTARSGRLRVVSLPGRGTTVEAHLPVDDCRDGASTPPEHPTTTALTPPPVLG